MDSRRSGNIRLKTSLNWKNMLIPHHCTLTHATPQTPVPHLAIRDLKRALTLVDEALVHTPTLVELYNAKVRLGNGRLVLLRPPTPTSHSYPPTHTNITVL